MYFLFFRLQVRMSPLFDTFKDGGKAKQKESDHMDRCLSSPHPRYANPFKNLYGFFIAPVDLEQMDLKI